MQNDIKRKVRAAVRDSELRLNTSFDTVPFVGPYLSARLQQFFHANSVHGFRNRIRHMRAEEVALTLKAALQNARGDSCEDGRLNHDYNWAGYSAMVFLVTLLSKGVRRTGGAAGPNNPYIVAPYNFTHFTHNSVHLRPPGRGVDRLDCLPQGDCQDHPDGAWVGGRCQRNLRVFERFWPEYSPQLHGEIVGRARQQPAGARVHGTNFGRITAAEFAVVRPHVLP
jgi:hypothetical protein